MPNTFYTLSRRAWWALNGYPAHQIACLLNESQWWPRQKLEEFRDEKLRQLIDHCYQHVPYYRRIMDERGLRPVDIQSAVDLHKLPILTKDIIRANWKDLRATNIPDKYVYIAGTGGSTGEPIKIATYKKAAAWAMMSFERGMAWGGLTPRTTAIRLMGGSLGGYKKTRRQKISDRLRGVINLLAYDLGPDNVLDYAAVVRKHNAQFIIGYAGAIYHFARLLLECGKTLKLQAVFTTAERLYPEWAETIRQAMHCHVYSYYGCGECKSLGYQCQEGDTYHIPEEHAILEVEYESCTSLSGTGGVLITDLDNHVMPLLRYQNGDYLTLENSPCSCGRSLKLISKLEGRIREFLLDSAGQRVSGGISTFIMRHLESVNEFQVRQDALDHIQILVVLSKNLTEADYTYIRQSFCHYLGEKVDIEIRVVDSIERTRAQKLQIVVNELL
jgi:phenylacetate-CoA ligase